MRHVELRKATDGNRQWRQRSGVNREAVSGRMDQISSQVEDFEIRSRDADTRARCRDTHLADGESRSGQNGAEDDQGTCQITHVPPTVISPGRRVNCPWASGSNGLRKLLD